VPRGLLREDGRSVYRRHGGTRYAMRAQLSLEEAMTTQAAGEGAPRMTRAAAAHALGADLARLESLLVGDADLSGRPDELRDEIKAGVRTSATYTIEESVTDWLESIERNEHTMDTIAGLARNWIYPRIGAKKLRDFSATDADRFFRQIAPFLSKRSLVMIKSTLRRSIRRAQVHALIGWNVIELIDIPAGKPGRPSRAMTEEQAAKVLTTASGRNTEFVKVVKASNGRYGATHAATDSGTLACGIRSHQKATITELGPDLSQVSCRSCVRQLGLDTSVDANRRLAALFVLSIRLGLRPGELRKLSWDMVDLSARVVHVWRSASKSGDTKTPKSKRSLVMPQRAIRALETHKAMQDREREAAGKSWQETNLVFCHENGEMYTSRALNWRFSRMTRKAGIGHWHAHEGRHTAVSIMSSNGVPIQDISDTVGHKSTHVTETVYRHVIVPTIRGGATVMDSVFGPEDDEIPPTTCQSAVLHTAPELWSGLGPERPEGENSGAARLAESIVAGRSQVRGQSRYLASRDDPYLVRVDAMVVVRENDAQADDVAPWHFRMLGPEFVGQRVGRFSDDLQQALRRQLPEPVLVPCIAPDLRDVHDLVGSIKDVLYPLFVAAAHRSTDSARMCRSRSFSPPVDTTSTGWPSSSSSSLAIRMRSNRELSGAKSTSRSMSLSGRSSPRATEPKTRTRFA
jgi:integrase